PGSSHASRLVLFRARQTFRFLRFVTAPQRRLASFGVTTNYTNTACTFSASKRLTSRKCRHNMTFSASTLRMDTERRPGAGGRSDVSSADQLARARGLI